MPYTPDIDLYMDFGSGLVSVGEDVLITRADIVASWGQTRSDPLSRIATTGVITFLLNNSDYNSDNHQGYYSPNHDDERAGFDLANPILLWIKYGTTIKCKRYYITSIIPVSGENRERQTAITATDFMAELAKQSVAAFVGGAYVRTDLAMAALIPNMPTPPLAHNYSVSPHNIEQALNDLEPGTTYLQACQHLAMTDAGYIFSKGQVLPIDGPECLTDGGLENWITDNNLTSWTEAGTVTRETVNKYSGTNSAKLSTAGGNIHQNIVIPIAGHTYLISGWIDGSTAGGGLVIYTAGFAVRYNKVVAAGISGYFQAIYIGIGDETSIYFYQSNVGTIYGDAFSVKEITGEELCYENWSERAARGSLATFDNTMVEIHAPYNADNILNDIRVSTFPFINSDPVVEVLYLAPAEIKIPAGDFINFRVDFVDPTLGSLADVALVNGSELCVAGTDYKVTATEGSGGNDAILEATVILTYLAKCCYVNMANVAAYDIWVAPFQIRGYILRTFPAQTTTLLDTAANYIKYGRKKLNYPMYYQNRVENAFGMANKWFNDYHLPATFPTKDYMDIIANTSDYLMNAAINLDIGDKITIAEEITGITMLNFHIIGVRMTIKNGTALYVRYYLEPNL